MNTQLSESTQARIVGLIEESHTIPIENQWLGGFLDRGAIIRNLFSDCILDRHLSANSIKAIEEFHWTGDVTSIYNEINSPKHPIRNYLIRNEIDLTNNILEFKGYETV